MITDDKEREGIIREAALWAIRNHREALGDYFDTSDEVLDEVELSLAVAEPSQGPSIWSKYDILMDEDDEDEDEDEDEGVMTTTLVASGWEWICPHCEKHQLAIEAQVYVTCVGCGRGYATEIAE